MKARRVLLLTGSLWEIFRFFLLISLLAFLLHKTSGAGQWVFPWLLLCGSGSLLVGAGGIMLALFPESNDGLIGLLRLGKVLALFCYALLLISGAMRMAVGLQFLAIGGVPVTQAAVLFGVFVLDLLFLVLLIFWSRWEWGREIPATGVSGDLAEYTETEARDFH